MGERKLPAIDPEFIVICASAWMNERGFGFGYDWDGARFGSRAQAIKHGWKQRGSDDFNIGMTYGDDLIWFGWQDERMMEATLDFSATSAASLTGLHQPHVIPRLLSRLSPPFTSAIRCSTIQLSPVRIFRPHSPHLPSQRVHTRRRTRGGMAVSGVLPIHSSTARAVMAKSPQPQRQPAAPS